MTNEEMKNKVIDYWKKNVEPCKDMKKSDVLKTIINYLIEKEYKEVIGE